MDHPEKRRLKKAMALSGFENWRPAVDVPELNRPQVRPSELEGTGRIAAVLVLLYASSGNRDDLKLVLTKRHVKLANHGGQISFPGGRQDANETLWQTATRETFEEVGIAPGKIDQLGRLNPVYIPPSDFTVDPFVGWHHGQPDFVRSEEEVDEIIEASVQSLLNPDTLKRGDIKSASGMNINVPYYQVGAHRVWGATAIMLGELIERIRQIPPIG